MNQALPVRDDLYRFTASHPAVRRLSDWDVHKVLMRFAPGLDRYVTHARAVGLAGLDRVLDAGCGYGQWSLALAQLNRRVVSLDHSDRFLNVARPILTARAPNAALLKASIEDLPLPDACMDAVLCAEVIFYTDEDAALKELHRILKPGGRLYLVTAGLGYHLEYVSRNLLNPMGLIEWLAYVGWTVPSRLPGARYRGQVSFLSGRGLRERLRRNGFLVKSIGGEGAFQPVPAPRLRRARFCGCYCWIEAVAERERDAPSAFQTPVHRRPIRRTYRLAAAALGAVVVIALSPRLLIGWMLGAADEGELIPTTAKVPVYRAETAEQT